MTASEVKELSRDNYEIIKGLSIIYDILRRNGKIISNEMIDNGYSEIIIENDNIIYKLLIAGNDTCKSIVWERRKST